MGVLLFIMVMLGSGTRWMLAEMQKQNRIFQPMTRGKSLQPFAKQEQEKNLNSHKKVKTVMKLITNAESISSS